MLSFFDYQQRIAKNTISRQEIWIIEKASLARFNFIISDVKNYLLVSLLALFLQDRNISKICPPAWATISPQSGGPETASLGVGPLARRPHLHCRLPLRFLLSGQGWVWPEHLSPVDRLSTARLLPSHRSPQPSSALERPTSTDRQFSLVIRIRSPHCTSLHPTQQADQRINSRVIHLPSPPSRCLILRTIW